MSSKFDTLVIYMCKGVPSSGKTTWARDKMKGENNIKRFSKDDMRNMLDNGEFSMKNEGFILDMRDEIVESALLRGNDVIVDDTNFPDKHFQRMCDIARRVGNVGVKEKYFDISLREAIKRNEKRDKEVPNHVIEKMFKNHVRGGVKQRDRFFPKVSHPHDREPVNGNTERGIIVDMDGTLCKKNTDRGYYEYNRVIEDDPNIPVIELVLSMKERGYKVYVVTGREETGECRDQCEEWLDSFEVPYDKLMMRGEGDYRGDNEIKKEIYWDDIHDEINVQFVVDDRMSVTNMWRSLGIPTFQVEKGTF